MLHDAPSGPLEYGDVELRGSGATSQVYRAIERSSGRVVALKRLNRNLVRTSESLVRFRRELDALRRIRHPGIARVHDVIEWNGDPTLVMDYIEGADLHELVAQGEPLAGDEAMRIARELFDILAASHGAGIVHRDVKPQNVRITAEGRVMLLDFGSARLDAASKLTATGTTVGTPEYMPPELFAGGVYDPRVDIYGAGATIFYALSGRPPHAAESLAELATLRSRVDAPPIASLAPETPAPLAQVVDRCLARDASHRYAAASLAVWALDHPDVEREFAARRSRLPCCLHCEARIAPESAVCAHCKSPHPFGYQPGLSHVDIHGVSEPKRFIEHVVTEFPEYAKPEALEALAERCAALSFGAQRYVSFIDKAQAETIVKRLALHGARAHIVNERRPMLRALVSGLAGAVACFLLGYEYDRYSMLAQIAGLTGFVGFSILALRSSLYRAANGVLAPGRFRRPISPAVLRGAVVLSIGAALWTLATLADLQRYIEYRRDDATDWMVFFAAATSLSAALVCAVTAIVLRFRGARLRGRHSPEASSLVKLWQLIVPRRLSALSEGSPQRVAGVFAAILVLVITEIALLAYLYVSAYLTAFAAPIVNGAGTTSQPSTQGTAAVPLTTTLATISSQLPWKTLGVAIGLVLASFLGMSFVIRQCRRIRADARQLLAEVDPAASIKEASRRAPRTRVAPETHGAPERIAKMVGADGFAEGAVTRAADLAQLVTPASSDRLTAAILTMGRRKSEAQIRERSLVARSILETDPSQKARFDYLALEAELEQEAAEAWWQARR